MNKARFINYVLLITVTAFGFSACSSSEDNDTYDNIVGTWMLKSEKISEIDVDNDDAKDWIIDFYKEDYETSEDVITFYSDGTYAIFDGEEEYGRGNYKINGDQITIDKTIQIAIDENTFSFFFDVTKDSQEYIDKEFTGQNILVKKAILEEKYQRVK